MEKDLTLLILAAGMGSRFGGLKQIEPVGPNGEFLIDYSIYDAIRAGFTKVVFVIKKENEKIFKETVGSRVAKKIKVEYAFQEIDDLPSNNIDWKGRTKPWGTAHAVLCAKELIHEPFLMINADDFYGYDAYQVASRFLKERMNDPYYCIVGYQITRTLSEHGCVKRGICSVDHGKLVTLTESNVERVGEKIIASPLDHSMPFEVSEDCLVSMNMLGFTPSLFPYLEKHFSTFLEMHKNDILTCEYLIPDSVKTMIEEGYIEVEMLSTSAEWLGMTYREDKEKIIDKINQWIKDGIYPENLWEL